MNKTIQLISLLERDGLLTDCSAVMDDLIKQRDGADDGYDWKKWYNSLSDMVIKGRGAHYMEQVEALADNHDRDHFLWIAAQALCAVESIDRKGSTDLETTHLGGDDADVVDDMLKLAGTPGAWNTETRSALPDATTRALGPTGDDRDSDG